MTKVIMNLWNGFPKIKNKTKGEKMNTVKIFGVVVEGDEFKAYELNELEGTGVYVNYVLQCTTPQINNVVRMLNNVKKEIK